MSVRHAAAVIAVALVGLAMPSCGLDSVKDEAVVLADVRDAFVLSGSSRRSAVDGEKLAKNDVVSTVEGGTATLVVRDRRVVLGGLTDVTVPDGETVQLERGALLVDRRRGPNLEILAGDTTVDEVGNGVLRVEKSFALLVAGLSGGARVRTVTGARLDLDPLYQVVAPGRSLPRTALPLQLRGDVWERSVIPDVVADDDRLNDLARGLDTSGAGVLPVTYRGVAKPSDLVLADSIGRAAARDELGRRSAANRARLLRGEGGSWGVVARLLDTTAVDVGSALAEVLRGIPATSPDPVAPGTTPAVPGGTFAGASPQPGVPTAPGQPSPNPTSPGSTRPPTRTPSSPASSSPGTQSPSPDPVEALISSIPTPPPLLPTALLP